METETKHSGEFHSFPINEETSAILQAAAIKDIPVEVILCHSVHRVDGEIPKLEDSHFDGRTCDCGRMIYKWERCLCGSTTMELHGYPNENFNEVTI